MQTTLIETTTQIEDRHTSGAYYKRPLTLVRGEGVYVWDDAGNRYLDATSGQGVALLGHAHPAVAKAVAEQAQTLITCPEIFYNNRRAELYSVLTTVLPPEMSRFFLCNSGAEANEGALKIARLLTGRTGIVAAKRGFHGRTLGSLGMTWNKDYREPFAGWTPGSVTHISFNDFESADGAINDTTAAVFVEAVQGEGGVYPADPEWVDHLRTLCTERGAMLVMDEIQTGLGRTGRWFGFQHAAIMPDIITLGKGIAGGIPMGAVAWRESLGKIEPGTHGSTFGGNPLACAAAIASLTTLRDMHIDEHVAEEGAWLMNEIRALNLHEVREVRGLGLIIGLELRGRVTPALQGLTERGVLALPAGKNVLRLLPPLIITREESMVIVNAIRDVLS
jgi:LysW-gamma-L-lysine/LysW-L-ornithine aminotransferase